MRESFSKLKKIFRKPKNQLTSLPAHLIEDICQLLLDCNLSWSVLQLRATNSKLFHLINDFSLGHHLKLTLDGELRKPTFLTHIRYLTQETTWTVDSLTVICSQNLETLSKTNFVAVCREHNYIFENLKKLIFVNLFSESDFFDICEAVCTTATDIHLTSCPLKASKYEILRKSTFGPLVTSMSCPVHINFAFPSLRSLTLFNHQPANISLEFNVRFQHLTQLRLLKIDSSFWRLLRNMSNPVFQNVTALEYHDSFRVVSLDEVSVCFGIHFTNLVKLKFLAKIKKDDEVPLIVPQSCRHLYADLSFVNQLSSQWQNLPIQELVIQTGTCQNLNISSIYLVCGWKFRLIMMKKK